MKKFISLFLSIIILISAVFTVNLTSFATTYTDNCGDGSTGNTVAYTYDTETGICTISGKGAIKNCSDSKGNPDNAIWYCKYDSGIKEDVDYGAIGMKELKILNGVTSIGDYFSRRKRIYGSSLTYYSGLENLEKVELGLNIKTIGNSAFLNCSKITRISIPNATISIGTSAFSDCASLESVSLGNSVKELGEYAFYNDSALSTLEISTNLEIVGKRCFYKCSSLDGNLTFGSKLSYIGQDAFSDCFELKSVKLSNSLETLGAYAFSGCRKLRSITIPESVKTIERYSFCE